jgi:heme oxygenase
MSLSGGSAVAFLTGAPTASGARWRGVATQLDVMSIAIAAEVFHACRVIMVGLPR